MKQALIYNPHSGRGFALRWMAEHQHNLRKQYHYYETAGPGGGLLAARQAIAEGCQRLVALGGDGTVHEVANGILLEQASDVIMSTIPLGSANDFAYTLGLEIKHFLTEEACSPLICQAIDTGRVTASGRTRYFVNCMGIGFNGMVTTEAIKIRWLRGLPLYTAAFLAAMIKHYHAPRTSISMDGLEIEQEVLAFTICNAQREGGFPIGRHALLDDGYFDYMMAGGLSRGQLVRFIPKLISGELPENHPRIKLGRCQEIHYHSPRPLCIHTDGEFFCRPNEGIGEVSVKLLPKSLKVEVFSPQLYGGRTS